MSKPSQRHEEQPNYYAIIPAPIRYCKDLEPSAKLLYGEISALCSQQGFCWATNRYFSELYGVQIRTIQMWLESLVRNNFITVEVSRDSFNSERKIYLNICFQNNFTACKKSQGGVQKIAGGGAKNFMHNNTPNNTSNNTYPKSSSSLPSSSFETSSSIDDDEPGGADKIEDMKKEESEIAVVGDIFYTKTNGTKEKISQTDIYRHFLRKNYDTSTLKEAIKRTQTAQGSINNILKYIESICKQIEDCGSNKEVLGKQEKKEEPKKEIKKEQTITWAEYEASLKKGES